MDGTLERALQTHADSIKSFTEGMQAKMRETADRLMDVEQKIARRPGGSTLDAAGGDSIASEVINSPSFAAMKDRLVDSVRFKLARSAFETKAAILGSSTLVAADRRPEIISPVERRFRIRDLIPTATTDSNSVEYARELTFTNNAGPQYEASPQSTEGALKAESSMTFELVTKPVITIAHHIPASRQVLADNTGLKDLIDRRLRWGLKLEEETEILTGTGANGELSGLLASGNYTAYGRGATGDTAIDTLRKAITQLDLSDHVATGIVLNPSNWEAIELSKDAELRHIVGNPKDGSGSTLWGLPVVVTNSMTAGTFIVADFAHSAMIFDREDVMILIGTINDDFTRNLVRVLCEERIALAVHTPLGIVAGTL